MLTTDQILLTSGTGTMVFWGLVQLGSGLSYKGSRATICWVAVKRIDLANNWFRGFEAKDLLLKIGFVVKLDNRVVDNKPKPAF